jgi:PAS domain S-box-containing protein/diguanylate cyclase (GGDEF)-like protein
MSQSSSEGDDPVVECALRDRTLHKTLIDRADKGVCIVDRDFRILYWNAAAERMSGYLAQEVAGQANHGDLLMHCPDYDALLGGQGCELTELVLAGNAEDSIVLLLNREGYRILVYVQSRAIHDSSGATIGAVQVFEEVMASPHRGIREFEAFGCSDSFLRAAHRKYGEMRARHALEALNMFEIPFGWLRVGLDGAEDLDHNFGHGMVDAAVKMVAAALDRNLGALGVLTRWEGDGFRVQINRCTHSEVVAAAERLCLLVRVSSVDWWGDRRRVTVSVGGATAERGDTLESLDARVSEVFDGCRTGGGDRAAVAHISKSGAVRCLP